MSACKIPQGYDPKYGIMDTERAIKRIKDFFETELSKALNLSRISAPLFVKNTTGLNDNLNGVERPVSFQALCNRCRGRHLYRYECNPPR